MKKSLSLLNIAFGAIFGLLAFVLILVYSSPKDASSLIILLFYSSLFLWVGGVLALLFFAWRAWRKTNTNQAETLRASFRQAALLSSLLVAVLVFQSLKVFSWWAGGLLLLLILGIEIYCSRKTKVVIS